MHIRSAGEQRVRDLLYQSGYSRDSGADPRNASTATERSCAPVSMRPTLIISIVLLVALVLLLVL